MLNLIQHLLKYSIIILVRELGGYVYILTNKIGTVLYVGVTSNLQKRIWEHKQKIV